MILLHFFHFINFLRSSKITQINLHPAIRLIRWKHLLNQQLKQCMRPTAFNIHTGLPDNPIFFPFLHKFQTLLYILNLNLTQPLNINTIIFILMY